MASCCGACALSTEEEHANFPRCCDCWELLFWSSKAEPTFISWRLLQWLCQVHSRAFACGGRSRPVRKGVWRCEGEKETSRISPACSASISCNSTTRSARQQNHQDLSECNFDDSTAARSANVPQRVFRPAAAESSGAHPSTHSEAACASGETVSLIHQQDYPMKIPKVVVSAKTAPHMNQSSHEASTEIYETPVVASQAGHPNEHTQIALRVPLPAVHGDCCREWHSVPGIAFYVCLVTLAAAVLATLQSIYSATGATRQRAGADTSVDTSMPYAIIVGVSDICRLFLQIALLGVLFRPAAISASALLLSFPSPEMDILCEDTTAASGDRHAQMHAMPHAVEPLHTSLARYRDAPTVLQLIHLLWLHLQRLSPVRAAKTQRILHYLGVFVMFSWLAMAGVAAEQGLRALDPAFRDSISYQAYGGTDASAYGLEVFFIVFCFIPSNLGVIAAVWLLVCSSLISRQAFAAISERLERKQQRARHAVRHVRTGLDSAPSDHVQIDSSGEPNGSPPGDEAVAARPPHRGAAAPQVPASATADVPHRARVREELMFIQAVDAVHASVAHAVRLLSSLLSPALGWLLLLAGLGWVSALASIIVTASASQELSAAGLTATLLSVAVAILVILVLLAAGAAVTFSANMVHQTLALLHVATPLHTPIPSSTTCTPAAEASRHLDGADMSNTALVLQVATLRAHSLTAMHARHPGWYIWQRRIDTRTVVSVVSVLAAIASLSLQQLAVSFQD